MGIWARYLERQAAENKEAAAGLSDSDMPHAATAGENQQTADVTNAIFADASKTFRDETGE